MKMPKSGHLLFMPAELLRSCWSHTCGQRMWCDTGWSQCRCTKGQSSIMQAYTALLGSAVKCGEAELAVDVYGQLRAQGFQLERHVFHVVLEVFLKLGRWQDALSVMDDMAAQVDSRV